MERVLVECDRAETGFDADAVHDLRVALRRCRSLADGLMAIDPDPAWKEMKKAGKKLFQALGELRDMQVMEEWLEKLSPGAVGDAANSASAENRAEAVAVKLLDHIQAREAACKQLALTDLNQFDRKQWRRWSRELPRRASRVRSGSVVYVHLALEKWTAAYDLHKHALRSRSRVGLHTLRIGIKRFRYTVENFLPEQHALWGADLKELQDLLGEVHDLDVLWATALEIAAFPDAESRARWLAKVNAEREKRVSRYRELMVGRESLWRVWRAQFPSGAALRAAALARLRIWAGYLDPDFVRSQRVARLALALYDGLRAQGLMAAGFGNESAADSRAGEEREVLQAAAFMHDVGKAKGAENHQKKSYRMIRNLVRPLGWSARELELAAVVARYHRGALPHPRRKTLQLLDLPDRHLAVELAGVLRLAKALESHNGHEPRIEVQLQENFVLVRSAGYSALERSAEGVAAARHLLETVLRRPVLVRTLRVAAGRAPQRKPLLVARS
jgi:exopolyphosphatase/guanosine-5'-triphosphate,3'-diphosphate pyrophosphatase